MTTTWIVLIVAPLALAALLAVCGACRWTRGSRKLHARLEAARTPVHPLRVELGEIEGAPAPVQAYLRAALTDGHPMVAGVRVRHSGTIDMGETTERWRPFSSKQRVIVQRPGFDWDARVRMMPGLVVRVHDAYVAGEGMLHAELFGLLTVADLRGTRDIAEGELIRFLAETAWYPTALLPGQGVRWDAVDARSARATLSDGPTSVTLLCTFAPDGMIERVRAEARGRMVGKEIVPTPWEGRFWNYAERDGMRIPLDGEVSWVLPEGPRPYWRGRITEIAYEFAE